MIQAVLFQCGRPSFDDRESYTAPTRFEKKAPEESLPAKTLWEGHMSASERTTRPNILLLYTDEHHYQALGAAGNPDVTTPNLDRLAEGGVRFSRTYCQSPLCQPSRASFITGRYVHGHGQTWNRWNMDSAWPTLMKQLQRAGYTTAVTGKTHFFWDPPSGSMDLRESEGFIRDFGFDYVMEEFDKYTHTLPNVITPYTRYLEEKGLLDIYRQETPSFIDGKIRLLESQDGIPSRLPQEADLTCFVADRAIDWLNGHDGQKPFFLWVSFVGPHPPIKADPVWSKYYLERKVKVPIGPAERPPTPDNAWGRYLRFLLGPETPNPRMSPEVLGRKIREYYGMISLIDQRIGDILAALGRRGWENDTWVLFTSDHGEMMGDHSLMYKYVFYKGSVLVPNIIHPPGGMAPRVVDGLAESIDVSATILDLAGAKPPAGCQGRSLLPFLSGTGTPRQAVFSELAGFRNQGNSFAMVATDRYRYTYDQQNDLACELFDLDEDPDEIKNLVDDPASADLRERLHQEYLIPFLEDRSPLA